MDPPDSQSQEQEAPKKNGVVFVILRWILAILFPFLLFLSIPFLLGLLVLMFADFSIPNPISLPSQCKIVSTGVDIRSSKICELGLLDYKAKDVFHHFERSKFRCRYDYYWASVFKVEYKDHFSGQTQVAFAEAPNEALPLYCRPNFGAAWLTQYKFKVNETYDCWYTSGISKVRLHQDSLFGCDAHEQSTLEKSRQYSTMAMEMVISWFSSRGRTKHWRWETLAGVVTGFLTSLISITFIRFLQLLLPSLYQSFTTWIFSWRVNAVLIRRACFLLAYLSFVAWLAIEYGKRLGLMDIFRLPKS
ncbi:hypothetical protein AAZX31_09G195100 [Glycine max]|uniref:Uncharacterized protein n=2 Tax=Glycine subgen. Soja TaxID=1462606 RepID=I1L561_SOYBN|nr:uncharacterized protein LOC100813000 [Glycine max]XP_028247442.1 uncharacterized protein LOC114424948 [Glycine soja]KAG5007868.1 hypothetical protein JHK85_026410 [Glycine max]KAH1044111.1 hypothetical protein GYH30_025746 [Glycine max]KAH1234571.1 hypothetical protein GmHk_09G026739 [Glycine max]KAH1234572.1 hypothetical protein GmHk_09G026739 [Glycine max]KHN11833.1 hypothetical protein glysoja_006286 [Glycine soja]|eukprot:XP_003534316.1 uncharacterized protein LOC100813000 [Glycine max]